MDISAVTFRQNLTDQKSFHSRISLDRNRVKVITSQLTWTYGAKIETIEADLTKNEDLARVEHVLATNPAVSLLVNNAGNGKISSTVAMPDADAASTIALNSTALTRLTRAVLPALLSRNEGAITNISSVMALHSLSITSLYSATKGFVLNFSRGLLEELTGGNVKVQVILPAGTATELYDQAGMPNSAFDPAAIMTTENMVDAALAGFDRGEAITRH